MKKNYQVYRNPITLRGDMLYCPLSLTIDSYWQCAPNCLHCYMRRLNRTWGEQQRTADPTMVFNRLQRSMERKAKPTDSIGWALKLKKTIRIGNKTDPYQPIELKREVTRQIIAGLVELKWSFVIQSRFCDNIERDFDILQKAHELGISTIMPVITPGEDDDWEEFEQKLTTPVHVRYAMIRKWIKRGWNVGVNGEPFIPSIHTYGQFRGTLMRLKECGVKSYNTYPIHFNDLVAKNLAALGFDIEKVWWGIQDKNWRPTQQKLCRIAERVGIRLGCPDFVNTGPTWRERANTCCGINVPNPSRFTTHKWKKLLQKGWSPEKVLKKTWEGIGDKKLAEKIVKGEPCGMYTMKDAGVLE